MVKHSNVGQKYSYVLLALSPCVIQKYLHVAGLDLGLGFEDSASWFWTPTTASASRVLSHNFCCFIFYSFIGVKTLLFFPYFFIRNLNLYLSSHLACHSCILLVIFAVESICSMAAVIDRSIFTDSHAKSILSTMNNLRKSNTLCDVTLCVDGCQFPVHRIVLAACSDYFCAMFTHQVLLSRHIYFTVTNNVSSCL